MIKAVLFDVDGVLIDSYEANYLFYKELFIKAGYKPPTYDEYDIHMHGTLDTIIKELTHAPDEEVQRIWRLGKESLGQLYPYNALKETANAFETIEDLHKHY